MNSKNVLKVISVANAFIDGYNNHEYNNDEVNKSHNLNFGKIGMFLDFATVVMELCPIPQVKAAGFLLDGIIVAADFYNVLKDNDPDTKQNQTDKGINIIKLGLDSSNAGMDIVENIKPSSTTNGRIFTTSILTIANEFIALNNTEKEDYSTTEITLHFPDNPFLFPTGTEYKTKISTKYLEEHGLIDENGNFIDVSLSGNGFNLDGSDKDNDKNDKNDNKNQDGGNGDGSGNPSNNGGGTNPPQPQKYQPPTPPSKNPPGNGWDGGIKHAIDPVVLNLSEEGKAKSLENSFSHFDYDGDGFAEHTAWIGDKQGLLVVDINENGILNIIKFNSKKITSTDAEGNKLKSIGFFVRSDGTMGEIRDYYFETDEMNTFNKTRKYFLKLCLNIDNYILQEYYTPHLQIKDVLKGGGYGRNFTGYTRVSS